MNIKKLSNRKAVANAIESHIIKEKSVFYKKLSRYDIEFIEDCIESKNYDEIVISEYLFMIDTFYEGYARDFVIDFIVYTRDDFIILYNHICEYRDMS